MNIVTANTPGEMKKFGIYSITFQSRRGDMVYIGSTTQDFEQRLYEHLSALRRNDHRNKYLQRLWNKYGGFRFEIIEFCTDPQVVHIREQWHIECADRSSLINIRPARSSDHFKAVVSEETRRKQSESAKKRLERPGERERLRTQALGKSPSTETRKKISEASKKYMNSPEAKEKYSLLMKSRVVSDETRAKLSAAFSGKPVSPQTIAAKMKALIGRKQSEEEKRKRAESIKQHYIEHPEDRAVISYHLSRRVITEETRAKLSRASTGKHHSEETKEKLRQAALAQHARKKEQCTDQ